jgi:hypothetical protein
LPERALDPERRTGTQAAKDLFAELPTRRAESCGGLASEKMRGRSPGNMTSMYCPHCQANGA